MRFSTLILAVTGATAAMGAVIKPRAVLATVFPNYLIPLYQAEPDRAFGTQYTGTVSYHSAAAKNETTLLVGFDVPSNAATTCKLRFTLPQSGGFPWTVSGASTLNYYTLARNIQLTDTWNNRPARNPGEPIGTIAVPAAGGDAAVTGSIPCKKGQRFDIELRIKGQLKGTVQWFELTNPKTGITLEMSN